MNIEALEQRYQQLFSAYQANQVDEATFISEVDKLQFQDESGRYWMIGAQTGAWHFYDGQAWHQADPREADNLPVIDENGVYWQRGLKSGGWYFYQPETGEWIKSPDNQAPVLPAMSASQPTYNEPQYQPATPAYQPPTPQYTPPATPPSQAAGPAMPDGFEGELFQDEEGRYWSVGAKTGQWYFYDHNGWHPAQELTQQPATPTGYGGYMPPASQPYATPSYAPPQPTYTPTYAPAPQPYQQPIPQRESHLPREEDIRPRQTVHQEEKAPDPVPVATAPSPAESTPPPGSWSYFDGQSWRLSSPPVAETPAQPAPPAPSEPQVEVVEVEVIAVIEPEPDEVEEVTPPAKSVRAPSRPVKLAAALASDWASPHGGTSGVPDDEEVIPRRPASPNLNKARVSDTEDTPIQPRTHHTTPAPSQPAVRTGESVVVIPTGASPSAVPVRPNNRSRPVRPSQNPSRPVTPPVQRRARESTMPMSTPQTEVAPQREISPREVTQPMPNMATARTNTDPVMPAPAPTPPPVNPNAEPENLTFGEFIRAVPVIMWAGLGGVLLLVLSCVAIVFGGSLLNSTDAGSVITGLDASATPTLNIDDVPTGLPATSVPIATATKIPLSPTPSTLSEICSKDLEICVQAPEGWETKQDKAHMLFSTTEDGLDEKNITEAAFRIGRSTEVKVASDLLANLLANFPSDAKTLNTAPLGIAGQTWTSTQIQYADKADQEGIATLAVTIKDDQAYYLVAVAPAAEWNVLRETYQAMISGLEFVSPDQMVEKTPTVEETEEAIAEVTGTPEISETVTADDTTETPDKASSTKEVKSTPTPKSTATPKATATEASTATPTNTATPKATATPTSTPAPLTYTVVAGDSLGRIAGKFGVEIELLASENGLDKEKSVLQVGDVLIIPFTQAELDEYNKANGTPVASQPKDEPTVNAGTPSAGGTPTSGTPISGTTKATPKPTETSTPAVAPLSGRIVYPVFNSGAGTYDIWLADLATNEQVIIVNQASQPAFSRNGSLLAYRSWDIRSRGITYRDFVGGAGGQVTMFVEDGLPAWSPDGFTFVFSSRREGDRISRLYRADYTRKGSESGLPFEGNHLDVFPDGQIVARGCLPGGQSCGLYMLGSTGGSPVQIGSDKDTAPAASPNGSRIAFMSIGRGGSNWEVWTMNVDGSDPKQLTQNGSNDGLPTWSPDGSRVAFVSDQGGSWAVWVVNADGSNPSKLFDMKGSPDGKVLSDQNNSFGWWEERISWAP